MVGTRKPSLKEAQKLGKTFCERMQLHAKIAIDADQKITEMAKLVGTSKTMIIEDAVRWYYRHVMGKKGDKNGTE